MAKAPLEPANDGSQAKPNDTSSTSNSQPSTSIASQVAFLQKIVSSPSAEEGDVAALLKQLDVAEDVAEGVENKLDTLLENLEGMLQGLESKKDASVVEDEGGKDKDESGLPKPPDSSANLKGSG